MVIPLLANQDLTPMLLVLVWEVLGIVVMLVLFYLLWKI